MAQQSAAGEIAQLLAEWTAGPSESAPRLGAEVYRDLRQVARACMRHERPSYTLQATARVYEAYPRISQGKPFRWKNLKRFFCAMAQITRPFLVDHARECAARTRGGERGTLSLEAAFAFSNTRHEQLLALDESLEELDNLNLLPAQIGDRALRGRAAETDAAKRGCP